MPEWLMNGSDSSAYSDGTSNKIPSNSGRAVTSAWASYSTVLHGQC